MTDLRAMLLVALASALIAASAAVLACRELASRRLMLVAEDAEQRLAASRQSQERLQAALADARSEIARRDAEAAADRRRLAALEAEVGRLEEKSRRLRQESDFLWRQDTVKSELLQDRHDDMKLLHQELDRSTQERLEAQAALENRHTRMRDELADLRIAAAAADLLSERTAALEKRLLSIERAAAVVLAVAGGNIADDLPLLEALAAHYRQNGPPELAGIIEQARQLRGETAGAAAP